MQQFKRAQFLSFVLVFGSVTATAQVRFHGGASAWSPVPYTGPTPVFDPLVSYELSSSEPGDVELADFDADGFLDLAVTARSGHEITVVYGDGTGDFSDKEDFQAVFGFYDPGTYGITSGDFDDDGILDIAATLGASYDGLGHPNYKVNVFLGDGDRGFVFSQTVLSHGRFPIDCEGGDFDEDGIDDLAVISNHRGVDVFPSLGDGTFAPGVPMQGQYEPQFGTRMDSADFDQDGHLDLVLSYGSGHSIAWGDGTALYDSDNTTFVAPARNFAFGDVNLDGHLDLVSTVTTHSPNYVGGLWVMLGDGARGFQFNGRYGPSGSGAVDIGDINGDGVPDVRGLGHVNHGALLHGRGRRQLLGTGGPGGRNAAGGDGRRGLER